MKNLNVFSYDKKIMEIRGKYSGYINSLEVEDHTAEEWKTIITHEAKAFENTDILSDINYIIECLNRDSFVIDGDGYIL